MYSDDNDKESTKVNTDRKEKLTMKTDKSNIFHFVSLNVRGVRDKMKRSKVFSWIRAQKADIVCLQETFWTEDLENHVIKEWNGQVFFCNGSNHARGVSILLSKNLPVEVVNVYCKGNGRAMALRLVYQSKSYLVINIYAPTKLRDKRLFFKRLSPWLNKLKRADDLIICGGDWNTPQIPSADTRGVSQKRRPLQPFRKFIQTYKLVDIWRKWFPHKKQFTWRQVSMGIYSRLDYWLITTSLCDFVHSTDIRPALKCDHNAVSLKLKVSSPSRGKGYWKMNNTLLHDETFQYYVKNLIAKVKLEYPSENPQLRWEICKIKVRELAIKYSKQKQKVQNQRVKQLQKEFSDLSEMVDRNPTSGDIHKMENVKKELDDIYTYKCKGAYVRSREKWMEFGEKSTKYFLKREKMNGVKKEIDCIMEGEKLLFSQNEILNNIAKYYNNLYSDTNIVEDDDLDRYLKGTKLCELGEADANICEGILTEKECFKAIMSMPNNKAPGCDGLGVEFYKYFWSDIKELVVESLNNAYTQGELSESQRLGILTLLYKKGDKRKLDNWRPISLLNTDYKIIARVLSYRLQKVLHKIISCDQTGYIKGRSASDNLRLIQDIMDYCHVFKKKGILIFLDFKKAFDCVSHKFLLGVLKRFKFKESFIKWIEVLYRDATGKVINNGWFTNAFKIQRGIRQGCPLSALLFVLVVEVMATQIRSNLNIKGIGIPIREEPYSYDIRISQLADDATLIVDSIESGNNAVQEVLTFGKYAGLELNYGKTKILPLNIDINETNCINNLEWTHEPITYLGVVLCINESDFNCLNWSVKIDKIKRIIALWRMRNLTYYGKVVIVKLLLISQLIYLATCYKIPDKHIKELNKIIFSFLWNSKKEKVKRVVVMNSVLQGGLGMIDIESRMKSLKLSWLPKILNNDMKPWEYISRFWLNRIGGVPLCLHYNCSAANMISLCKKHELPPFYVDLLSTWAETHYVNFLQVKDVPNEIIWNNTNIMHMNETLYFKNWVENGILYAKQLIENGSWKNHEQIHEIMRSSSLLISFQYGKIKKAFPKVWIEQICDRLMIQRTHDSLHNLEMFQINTGDSIRLVSVTTKQFYSLLLDAKKCELEVKYYWQNKLNIPEQFDWNVLLNFRFGKLFNNNIKQYSFKLLHRLLPFKENLVKWKIASDMTCKKCNEVETIAHVLVYCPDIKSYWKKITDIIYNLFHIDIVVDERIILMGYNIGEITLMIPNLMLIFAQYTIYRMYVVSSFTMKVINVYTEDKFELFGEKEIY